MAALDDDDERAGRRHARRDIRMSRQVAALAWPPCRGAAGAHARMPIARAAAHVSITRLGRAPRLTLYFLVAKIPPLSYHKVQREGAGPAIMAPRRLPAARRAPRSPRMGEAA